MIKLVTSSRMYMFMSKQLTVVQIVGQDLPHFRAITNTCSGGKLLKSISYSRMREVVLDMSVGLDKRKFGLHSLRSNAGVPDSMFKWHRWWWSENATKDGHVQDALDERLKVHAICAFRTHVHNLQMIWLLPLLSQLPPSPIKFVETCVVNEIRTCACAALDERYTLCRLNVMN